jgi:hypothetical protein
MWQYKNGALSFYPEISFLSGFIFSLDATLPAKTDSGFHKFLIENLGKH